MAVSNPDFVTLAGAFGLKGYRVESTRQLAPIVADALAQEGRRSWTCRSTTSDNVRLIAEHGELVCPM